VVAEGLRIAAVFRQLSADVMAVRAFEDATSKRLTSQVSDAILVQ
jgi:hypothetical protein